MLVFAGSSPVTRSKVSSSAHRLSVGAAFAMGSRARTDEVEARRKTVLWTVLSDSSEASTMPRIAFSLCESASPVTRSKVGSSAHRLSVGAAFSGTTSWTLI